jgi:hypothetical protein
MELAEQVAYRCVALECVECDLVLTEGITKAVIDQHQNHFEKVTIAIEMLATGVVLELQPVRLAAV